MFERHRQMGTKLVPCFKTLLPAPPSLDQESHDQLSPRLDMCDYCAQQSSSSMGRAWCQECRCVAQLGSTLKRGWLSRLLCMHARCFSCYSCTPLASHLPRQYLLRTFAVWIFLRAADQSREPSAKASSCLLKNIKPSAKTVCLAYG